MIRKPETLEEWKEIGETHFHLCEILHENSDLVPEKLQEMINTFVYQHYEP